MRLILGLLMITASIILALVAAVLFYKSYNEIDEVE